MTNKIENGDVNRPEMYSHAVMCAAVMQTLPDFNLHDLIAYRLKKPITWICDPTIVPGIAASAGVAGEIKIRTAQRQGDHADLPIEWSYFHECAHIAFEHYQPKKILFGFPSAAQEYKANLFTLAYLLIMCPSIELRAIYVYTTTPGPNGEQPIFDTWSWDYLKQEVEAVFTLWEKQKKSLPGKN